MEKRNWKIYLETSLKNILINCLNLVGQIGFLLVKSSESQWIDGGSATSMEQRSGGDKMSGSIFPTTDFSPMSILRTDFSLMFIPTTDFSPMSSDGQKSCKE